MRQETMIKNIYTFDELTPEAQEKAIDGLRGSQANYDWYDFIYDDAATIFGLIGFYLDKQRFYFSGFWSQGDGACISKAVYSYKKGFLKAVKEYAPQDTELHNICQRLQNMQAGAFYTITAGIKHADHYYHERSMHIDSECEQGSFDYKDFAQVIAELCLWLYKQLEKEYDYLTSDEYIKENIAANGYEFTEDGKLC